VVLHQAPAKDEHARALGVDSHAVDT
jgi:hypothetical protein